MMNDPFHHMLGECAHGYGHGLYLIHGADGKARCASDVGNASLGMLDRIDWWRSSFDSRILRGANATWYIYELWTHSCQMGHRHHWKNLRNKGHGVFVQQIADGVIERVELSGDRPRPESDDFYKSMRCLQWDGCANCTMSNGVSYPCDP